MVTQALWVERWLQVGSSSPLCAPHLSRRSPPILHSVAAVIPAAAPKEKTRTENPPIKGPNLPNQVKVTNMAQAAGGKKQLCRPHSDKTDGES